MNTTTTTTTTRNGRQTCETSTTMIEPTVVNDYLIDRIIEEIRYYDDERDCSFRWGMTIEGGLVFLNIHQYRDLLDGAMEVSTVTVRRALVVKYLDLLSATVEGLGLDSANHFAVTNAKSALDDARACLAAFDDAKVPSSRSEAELADLRARGVGADEIPGDYLDRASVWIGRAIAELDRFGHNAGIPRIASYSDGIPR